jgi:DNA-binding HxlR family transcriptional regulator
MLKIEMDEARNTVFAAHAFMDQIANKWSVLILTTLCPGPQRFNAILRELDGVTQKALTQALRRLERNGLVLRRVLTSSPVAVEYSLTPLGHSLQKPFAAVYDWTSAHLPAIEQAQRDYDRRTED